jgi:hypothetical protein
MSIEHELIQRFHLAIPGLRQWIDKTLDQYADQVKPIHSFGFNKLALHYPKELLQQSKVIEIPHVPFPPLERLGLPEFSYLQQFPLAGITFMDTIFLRQGQLTENHFFHELVHVVQWARLGVDNFLLAYGLDLIQYGYEQSPLEQMAYSLQRSFENDKLPKDLVRHIQERTDAIWKNTVNSLPASSSDPWPTTVLQGPPFHCKS